ncbi:MAG TPA: PEP-CTERM sorting domain-containing protein [Bryobacteraceae bacterium]|nr:PEP-CTERM sorting domain-containing protein [Bryobacteraceae bacterium]
MKIIRVIVVSLFGASLVGLSFPGQAAAIDITYSFSGGLTAPPVLSGGLLYLNASAMGSVDQFALLNPVTFDTSDALDLSTGLDHGTFTWTFANGDTLFGSLFEDDTMVNLATDTGPFTQTLTFTGGTGEFAGVTGSGSGEGSISPAGYTLTGRGTLNGDIPGVPEPSTWVTLLIGFAGIGFMIRSLRSKEVAA